VIDDIGNNLGELSKAEALNLAKEKGLDLVLISKSPEGDVAKIIDFAKFKYLQSKKSKNKGKTVTLKEWQFKPKIEEFHAGLKLKKVKEYLSKGGKVKITVRSVRGTNYEDMKETMEKIIEMSSSFSVTDTPINKEGRNISVFLKYKKNEKKQTENTQVNS
jgi:translation initiation factor IF-3